MYPFLLLDFSSFFFVIAPEEQTLPEQFKFQSACLFQKTAIFFNSEICWILNEFLIKNTQIQWDNYSC